MIVMRRHWINLHGSLLPDQRVLQKTEENQIPQCTYIIRARYYRARRSFSIKRGNKTRYVCHLCIVKSSKLESFTKYARRTLRKTKNLLNNIQENSKASEAAKESLKDQYLFPVAPVPFKFTTFGVAHCVNIYAIFRIEPMHLLSIGICGMPKEYLWNFLEDCNRSAKGL